MMLFGGAQLAGLCLGIVAMGLLHKLGVNGFQHEGDLGNTLLGTLSFQGVTWLLVPLFLRQHHVGWREAFGLCGPKINRPGLLFLSFIIFVAVVLLLQGTSVEVLEKLGHPPEDQAAVSLLLDAKSWWTTAYIGGFAILIAPVAEEFIFRGLLFPFVKQFRWPGLVRFFQRRGRFRLAWFFRQRAWWLLAWFGVSALFALIHVNLPTFLPLFVFALGLTWLYNRTNNLLAPIAAHALFNAFNFAVLLWQIRHPNA